MPLSMKHHFYHGDPNKICEFALQDVMPYESSAKMMPLVRRMLACNSWHDTLGKKKRFPKSICSDLDTQMSHPRAILMKECEAEYHCIAMVWTMPL
jgi:hypothetical protein